MKQVKNRFSAWGYALILVSAILALGSLLVGCGSPEPLPGGEGEGEAIAEVVLEPTAAPATPVDEPTDTPEPVADIVDPLPADECLDCHTDKDMLIDTADPEEEVISENEGEG